LHTMGDTLLAEAKLLLCNGLPEDGALKLREARQHFIDAADVDSAEPSHYACRAYAEFILGQRSDARQTFMKAISVATKEWLDQLSTRDWVNSDMFPIPEDDEFFTLAQGWVSQAT